MSTISFDDERGAAVSAARLDRRPRLAGSNSHRAGEDWRLTCGGTGRLVAELLASNVALRAASLAEPGYVAAGGLCAPQSAHRGSGASAREHKPEAILAHPRFEASRTAYVSAMLALYEDDKFMTRLLMEAGRSLVFSTLVGLHAAHDETDRTTWPTLGLVQKTIQPHGVSSARRVGDIVARFVETGFLKSEAAASDRRVKILTPTARMLAHDMERLAVGFVGLDAMFPGSRYEAPLRRDPLYQQAHRAIGRTMIARSQRIVATSPAMTLFMEREAGFMILMKLMQMSQGPTLRMSFADIGNRFGVSRTHVRAVLQDAARQDLVALTAQTIDVRPKLISAFDRFVAATMAHHDAIHAMVADAAEVAD